MLDIALEGSAHRGRVALRQVNLVCNAIDGEADSRVCGAAVQVIFQFNGDPLRHHALPGVVGIGKV
jgi:hypothetical protein